MSLQQTLEQLNETPAHRDFRHELFELCMSEVDAGTLTLDKVPERIAHLSGYFSSVGGHAAVSKNVEIDTSDPQVITAVMEKSSAR